MASLRTEKVVRRARTASEQADQRAATPPTKRVGTGRADPDAEPAKAKRAPPMPFAGSVKVARSAKTGKIISAGQAAAEPDTTVVEAVARKPKKGKFVIPKNLAAVADLYKVTKDRRLAMEKEAAAVGEEEAALKKHLIDNLPKSQAGGITGKIARAEITKRDVPTVEDESAFMSFAKRKGNDDLVKTVPVMSAVQERWKAGKAVPGIGKFTVVSISLTKVK